MYVSEIEMLTDLLLCNYISGVVFSLVFRPMYWVSKGEKERKRRICQPYYQFSTRLEKGSTNYFQPSMVHFRLLSTPRHPSVRPHILQGTVQGSGQFKMSLLPGQVTFRQLERRHERRITRLRWVSGTIRRRLVTVTLQSLPSGSKVLRWLGFSLR
jgi:hypothetical protein